MVCLVLASIPFHPKYIIEGWLLLWVMADIVVLDKIIVAVCLVSENVEVWILVMVNVWINLFLLFSYILFQVQFSLVFTFLFIYLRSKTEILLTY